MNSGPQDGDKWTVTITRVIDGDTMEAEFPNGEIDTLRLLGVDTPETTLSRNDPTEWEGIPDTTAGRDHLFNWGERATAFATNELEGQTVRIAVDPEADRRGSFDRLLVYIYIDDDNFNKRLLTEGYARIYPSQFSLRDEFEAAEATAQQHNKGLWNFDPEATPTPISSTKGLAISQIHADATGNDNENLNDEYIRFENTGDTPLDLSGWAVRDAADHSYTFPEGLVIEAGAEVTLYTGSGTDTDTALYWGSNTAIWNNAGDTIIMTNESGQIMIEYKYSA